MTALCLVALAPLGGCGRSTRPVVAPADTAIERDVLRGAERIRATRDPKQLRSELVSILASLRRARGTSAAARRGRELAIEGLEATLQGIRSELDFRENDSGNVAAATKDARRADRYLRLGADRLRAAGRALGVRIGELNGH
ncbi:MAG: hypothetical protein ACXVQQ_00455 [Gaiellaceae bacterium]